MAAPLNTLALGDEAATGLGLNVPLTRALASLAGVLLCASTTALAGANQLCRSDGAAFVSHGAWTRHEKDSSNVSDWRCNTSFVC